MATERAEHRNQLVLNLRAFAKLYGYVRFFHPSDEASSIDWSRFAVLGAGRVLECADTESLRKTLADLFEPIAPTVQVYKAGEERDAVDLPGDPASCVPVCWQHRGYGTPESARLLKEKTGLDCVYTSLRTNRPGPELDSDLPDFGESPAPGECVDKPLDGDLTCRMPLCLWSRDDHTLPHAEAAALDRLKTQLAAVELDASGNPPLSVRLAAVIVVWATLQHFYPYFDVVPTDWKNVLPEALSGASAATTRREFHETIALMAVELHDGHAMAVDQSKTTGMTQVDLAVVEGRVAVMTAAEETGLRRGDVLVEVNGRPALEALREKERLISGSSQWKRFVGTLSLRCGPKTEPMRFLVQRGDDTALADVVPGAPPEPSDKGNIRELEKGIWYVDLGRSPMAYIEEKLDALARARGVIFDLRGYPKDNQDIICHLLTGREKRGEKWAFVPRIAWPDRERISGWDAEGWDQMQPREPRIKGKVVFLAGGGSISRAECVIGYVREFELAEIVGGPTAGANGDIVMMELPGGFCFYWTGLEVTKFDGSQFHLVGYQPSVPVERTLKAVQEGRDEYIEKALELIRG